MQLVDFNGVDALASKSMSDRVEPADAGEEVNETEGHAATIIATISNTGTPRSICGHLGTRDPSWGCFK